jgi:GT2 family glycosyltransferase
MQLSVVIVSWNTKELLGRCLESLQKELERLDAEVFVVDNNSSDGSAAMVAQEYPWVRLIANNENIGFAAANNQAFWLTHGSKILLLNPDAEVKPSAIRTLMQFLDDHPDAAIVAPQLLNSDGSIQRSCRGFPTFWSMSSELLGLSRLFPAYSGFGKYKMLDWDHNDEREVDQPEGACLLVRREILDQVGMFDEDYFMLFEEVDWCYRIKQAGWQIWFTPTAQVVHHYGQSIKQAKTAMILSSHEGLYKFWYKHYRNDRWYLDPIAKAGLMSLAYIRIAAYRFNAWLNSDDSVPSAKPSQ